MNWEKYGLRIGIKEESLSSSETLEAAVVALVGGQFQFPPNTVLVSAVYAVSLSKPLLKRLKLEIQHCIDLTGRPDLAQYLKFAIAPMSTPSLPYQFSIVEGGEFSSNSGYGFIERKDFCLVCILGLIIVSITGGGGGGGGQQQQGTASQGVGVVPAQGGNALAPQQQPGVNPQTQGEQSNQGEQAQEGQEQGQQQQGAQLQKGEQSQSQEEQQEEGDLQREGENQDGGEGEREPQEQPEVLGLQQQEGRLEERQEDPVHVTTKGNEEQIDKNITLVSTESIASPLVSPVDAFECKNETEVLDKPVSDSKVGKYIHSILILYYERYNTIKNVYIYIEVAHSTGVKEATNYAGLIYYEEKGNEDLVRFTAAKKLNALLEVIHCNSSLVY